MCYSALVSINILKVVRFYEKVSKLRMSLSISTNAYTYIRARVDYCDIFRITYLSQKAFFKYQIYTNYTYRYSCLFYRMDHYPISLKTYIQQSEAATHNTICTRQHGLLEKEMPRTTFSSKLPQHNFTNTRHASTPGRESF